MSEFVICIDSESNPASLIVGKVYMSEPDGYLYPASIFAPVDLPEAAKRALTAARV